MSATSTQISIELWSLLQTPDFVSAESDSMVVNVTISDSFIGEIEGVGVIVSGPCGSMCGEACSNGRIYCRVVAMHLA